MGNHDQGQRSPAAIKEIGLIYTIGHTGIYLRAIAKAALDDELIYKCEGGYAFQTVEDANRRIVETGHTDDWSVWEMDAHWETDVKPAPDGWWHLLTCNADIIRQIETK